MSVFKNKHVILAMFVAPVLAIITYYAVDYMVAEKPHVAQAGNTYKLVAMSNCRYQSGVCTLKNADVVVKLKAQRSGTDTIALTLDTEMPVQNILVSSVIDANESEPKMMQRVGADGNSWQTQLEMKQAEHTAFRLALNIADALYYAETSAVFIDYQTNFSRQNFAN